MAFYNLIYLKFRQKNLGNKIFHKKGLNRVMHELIYQVKQGYLIQIKDEFYLLQEGDKGLI